MKPDLERIGLVERPAKSRAQGFPDPKGPDQQQLEDLCCCSFDYFRNEINPRTGLVADKTEPGAPSSIAATGMALSTYAVAVNRGWLTRGEAVERTLKVLRFFHSSPQGTEPDATGYKGFYYHFLDMRTGRRAGNCELSTIDTAILMAGVLLAASYFDRQIESEQEIRSLAESLYKRIDWQWSLNGAKTISHGWKPESGFLHWRWDNQYSEAIILYVLAMGSPTSPIDPEGYRQWISTFELTTLYGIEHLYAGPLFIHQMSHLWLNFRGIHDDFNRKAGFDYFENSRRATYMQREYAIANPNGFEHYHKFGWGFTASDGPGPAVRKVKGVRRVFKNYEARGAPFGPDDGTISPWAAATSLPFAPEIVIETICHAIEKLSLKGQNPYGFDASFNPTFPMKTGGVEGWVSPWIFGLNQGPIILMTENFQTGLIWNMMQKCRWIVDGLHQAGFRGGWLDQVLASVR